MELIILLKAFILGIVEGATEFLPVSSTGHLIIAGDLLNFNDEKGKIFEVVIQLGSVLAVCWEYRKRLTSVTTHLGSSTKAQQFALNVFIACLPAGILGFLFHKKIEEVLFSPITVAFALIVGGLAILFIEKNTPQIRTTNIDTISPKQAFQVGCAQVLALFPGISRSGSTIMGGMLFGLSRHVATEFSFFLSIPIMFAATALDLFKNWKLFEASDIPTFSIGFITAFISALMVVKFLIRFVASHNFRIFAWYRIIFGIIVLAYFWH
jgi:undecaprenyl-diphosphatase